MRVYVFDDDPSLLNLLTLYLANKGHQVQGFLHKYSCPLYQLDSCICPVDEPCAEAVIVNTRVANKESLNVLIDQDQKGCKLLRLNKAVMSANVTEAQEGFIRDQGFSVLKKPFRLTTVTSWLDACDERLNHL